jgi:putative transposase
MMDLGDASRSFRFLIRDPDAKSTGVKVTQDADAGATGECHRGALVGTIRRELLDQILIINQRHAATALAQYQDHFNHHRHHALRQTASLRALPDQHTTKIAHVRRRDRLGGLLHEYHQVA